jgi:hypothetical protein
MRVAAAIVNGLLGVIVVATAGARLIGADQPSASLFYPPDNSVALAIGYILIAGWTAYTRHVPWAAVQWIAALVWISVFGRIGAGLAGREAPAPPIGVAAVILLGVFAGWLAQRIRTERTRARPAV